MSETAHNNPASPQADAHLAQLHKMSTTAGVTNTDYVAVNQLAIASVLVGLVSGLAFLSLVMLVIPLVGIIMSWTAMRQIKDSAGTQTGGMLAMLGMVLSIGCAAGAAGLEYRDYAAVQGDSQKIAETVSTVGELIRKGDYTAAYKLFDDDFQNRVKPDKFKSQWELAQRDDRWGKLQVMEWNKVTPVFESTAGSKTAYIKIRMNFEKMKSDDRFDALLLKVGDKWLIQHLPTFFPPPKKGAKDDGFNI